MDELFSIGLGIRFFELIAVTGGDLSKLLCFGISTRLEFEDEREVGFPRLGGWELFSIGLGIRFFELVSVMEGVLSGLLCFGFSIQLEFKDEREVGFSGLGEWEFNLSFEFKLG